MELNTVESSPNNLFPPGQLTSVIWRLAVIPGDCRPHLEIGNPSDQVPGIQPLTAGVAGACALVAAAGIVWLSAAIPMLPTPIKKERLFCS